MSMLINPSTQARPHAAKNLFCIQNSPKEAPYLHSALIPGATFLSPPPCPPPEILSRTCPELLLQLRSPFLSFLKTIPRISGLSQNHLLRTFMFLSQIQILGQYGDKETESSKTARSGVRGGYESGFFLPSPPSSPSYPRSSFQMGFLKKPLPPPPPFLFPEI